MEPEKEKALKRFKSYINNYDLNDPKNALKAAHTFRVAAFCEQIARAENLGEEDVLTAWYCGLLHDIGRFEQVTNFGTFIDSKSVDHAHLSCEILFGTESVEEQDRFETALRRYDLLTEENRDRASMEPMIREFIDDSGRDETIRKAIWWHSVFRYPDTLTDRQKLFCNILRDADKIDIFRVNVETPLQDIHNLPIEEFISSQVTPEVLKAFENHTCVLRTLKKTAVDNIVAYCSLYWELVYDESRRLAWEQGYLMKLANFQSTSPQTREVFRAIREEFDNESKKVLAFNQVT